MGLEAIGGEIGATLRSIESMKAQASSSLASFAFLRGRLNEKVGM